MAKGVGVLFLCALAVLMAAGVAAVGKSNFDYETASAERRQKHLENLARGFSSELRISSTGKIRLISTDTNSRTDRIEITLQYTSAIAEFGEPAKIEQRSAWMRTRYCEMAEARGLLDLGVTTRVKLRRPSGARLTVFNITKNECAPS